MKIALISIFYLFLSIDTYAKFEMIVLDSDISVDNEKLKKITTKIKRNPSGKKFLMAEDRDYYLEKYFYEFVYEKDNMERDIFYKKLMTYSYEDLQYQYKWLDRETYNKFLSDIPPL